jgi:Domain of unknown function (DUF4034)
MPSKKLLLSSFCLIFSSSLLYSQEGMSLGEIARRARAAKQNGSTTTGPTARSSPTSSDNSVVVPSSVTPPGPTSQPTPRPAAGSASKSSDEFQTPEQAMGLPPGIRITGAMNFGDGIIESMRELLEQEKFETIDMIADRARSTKQRFDGGIWKIHIIYAGLYEPRQGQKAGEAEWQQLLDRLKRWVAQRPDSITARVALAAAYSNYAWNARGNGYADSVTEHGWELFQQRMELSGKTLAEAFAMPTKCPEWYLEMQHLVRDLGGSKEAQAAAFEKAIAFEPDYQYYYRAEAESLQEKWGGEKGDVAAFSNKIADRIGGERGDMIYFHIALDINCNCGEDQDLHGLSLSRIERGFKAIDKNYHASLHSLNSMAYLASAGGDPLFANEMFRRIQDSWAPDTWKTRDYFETARDWAKAWEGTKVIEDALKAADDNLKTPEGSRFDGEIGKTFAAKYSAVVADCLKKSGDPFLIPFDLALRLGKDGVVEQVHASVRSRVSACLSPQMEKAQFPAPPQPSYWVKVHLQPSPEEIRKLKEQGLVLGKR